MIKSNFNTCGNEGPAGKDGATPVIGNNGNWWINGVDTRQPAQGPRGMRGFQGDKGEKGDVGIQGPKGDVGATGPQGPKGDIGATGPQGPKGDKGDNFLISLSISGRDILTASKGTYVGGDVINAPTKDYYWFEIMGLNDVIIKAYKMRGDEEYTRKKVNGVWGNWVKVYPLEGSSNIIQDKQVNLSSDFFNEGTLVLTKIDNAVTFTGSFKLLKPLEPNTVLANVPQPYTPTADRLIGVATALGFSFVTFEDISRLVYSGGDGGTAGTTLTIHGQYFI